MGGFMRIVIAAVAGLLTATFAIVPAFAQSKKPVGENVRYFTFYSDLMGDLPIDGVLRETRQGAKVVSAQLDLCHSVSATSTRKDRFVVNLRAEGNKLVGSGQSQEEKLPVKVDLTRSVDGDSVTFEGTITRGTVRSEVSSSDNTDMSEAEFQEGQKNETTITTNPQDFTEIGPDSLAAEVKREALPDLVKFLREQNVSVALDSLAQDCAVLRSGKQVVNITVDPQRAAAVLAKLKTVPGVTNAGWREGSSSLDRAVRVARADWRTADGAIDKEKLGAAIAASVSKALASTLQGSKWNETTGELTLNFKRPDQALPGLGFTELIELVVLAGPEKPGSDQNLIVWFGDPAFQTVDESAPAHLTLSDAARGNDEGEAANPEGGALMLALARDLKGRLWDGDKNAWK
jgi:hypothetical protein